VDDLNDENEWNQKSQLMVAQHIVNHVNDIDEIAEFLQRFRSWAYGVGYRHGLKDAKWLEDFNAEIEANKKKKL
jgi:hypothetical protein